VKQRREGLAVSAVAALATGLVALVACPAEAQEPAEGTPDVQAAARAFEQGQAAQLGEQYARAAELFELADRFAPSAAALRSAIRNHLAAENHVRAASLALSALDRYASDASTRQVADEALRYAPRLTRLEVHCAEPCAITIDGGAAVTSAVSSLEMFVEPGPHTVRAAWPGAEPVTEEVRGDEGAVVRLDIERPMTEPEPEPTVATPEPAPVEPEPAVVTPVAEPEASGLPTWVFFGAAGLTAAVAGVTVWSGLDTLSARDDYVADPTEAGYEDGISRQRRTNVLIGVSIGLAVGTAVVGAFLTGWEPDREVLAAARPSVWISDNGGGLGVQGAL
jgi:hypothetical protein